jgi:hydroxymethylpyrimidine pyrophosphatase-like HAD family hydrolase
MPSIFEQYPAFEHIDSLKVQEVYTNSLIHRQLTAQLQKHHLSQTLAFFTDMDDTFNLAGQEANAYHLDQVLKAFDIPKIAVTGATNAEIVRRSQNQISPWMEVTVGYGGLRIEVAQSETNGEYTYQPDQFYRQLIEESSEWDRRKLLTQVKVLIDELAETEPDFQLQFQNPTELDWLEGKDTPPDDPYKIGLYFFAESMDARTRMADLISQHFPNVITIICSEITHNSAVGREEKYCLDLTRMDKLGAVLYLRNILGISESIVAGDSGNDFRQLVFSPNSTGVVVGGFKPELLHQLNLADSPTKHIFIEHAERRGPASIVHAMTVLARNRAHASLVPSEKKYFTELYQALSKA